MTHRHTHTHCHTVAHTHSHSHAHTHSRTHTRACAHTHIHIHTHAHRDDIDALPRKSPHLVLSFKKQTERPQPQSAADTPAALGPGSYIHSDHMPLSLTGKYVSSGHKGIKAVDFSKVTARGWGVRPGSAPAVNDEMTVDEEAHAAAQNYFGDDLNPSDLIALQALDQKTRSGSGSPKRTSFRAGAAAEGGSSSRPGSPERSQSPTMASPGTGPIPLGPDDLVRYGTGGLANSLHGGSFTRTSRAQEVQGMRACADGKVRLLFLIQMSSQGGRFRFAQHHLGTEGGGEGAAHIHPLYARSIDQTPTDKPSTSRGSAPSKRCLSKMRPAHPSVHPFIIHPSI